LNETRQPYIHLYSPNTSSIKKEIDLHVHNKLLSYRGETALQGALVLTKSGRLELGDNILRTL